MTVSTRLDKLIGELSPKQRVLANVAEWRDSATPGEYARRRHPHIMAFNTRLEQVREALKRQYRGQPREVVDAKVRAAAQEFVFLDELVERVNTRMCEQYMKFVYMGLLLAYLMNDEHAEGMCHAMADEVIGETEIIRRIQDEYFDGHSIIFAGARDKLDFAERVWWACLRSSGDLETTRDFVLELTASYTDMFFRGFVTVATIETHEFFGRDREARALRESIAAWADSILARPQVQA